MSDLHVEQLARREGGMRARCDRRAATRAWDCMRELANCRQATESSVLLGLGRLVVSRRGGPRRALPACCCAASCCWQSPVGRAVGFRQSQPGGRVSQEQIGRWARNPGAGRGAEEQQGKPCRVSWAGEVDEGRTHSPVGSRSTGFFLWLQRAGRAAIGRAASRRAAGAGEAGGWRGGVGCQGRRVRARAVWLVMPS